MRHRFIAPLCCALLGALSACHPQEEENVQTRAENASRALQDRYKALEAEAENRTGEAIAPLDNEAEALLANQADANAAAGNAMGNVQ
ncbi:MAG: hypothetical protein JWO25_1333 [Alphaproteobacteria bacterium]|nr:hypothetical protein [Alphaproteobacteria bacterium]MDB5722717.1 hypothetical protein [Alphaproteobacteria bacterium]